MAWLLIIFGVLFVVGGILYFFSLFQSDSQSQSERIEHIYNNNISVDMNPVAAKKEKIKSEARTNLINQLNIEADGYAVKTQKEAEAEMARVQQETSIVENKTIQKELVARQELIDLSLEQGWDVATYLDVQKMIAVDKLTAKKQWEETEQSMKAGFVYQMKEQQHLLLMTDYINGLYEKSRNLEKEGKEREFKLIEEHIKFMEGDFRDKQRLLQANNGQEFQGSDEDTDDEGDS